MHLSAILGATPSMLRVVLPLFQGLKVEAEWRSIWHVIIAGLNYAVFNLLLASNL
jgi:hypothetical protein